MVFESRSSRVLIWVYGVMGVLLATVVGYGFLNPAFREMDAGRQAEATR